MPTPPNRFNLQGPFYGLNRPLNELLDYVISLRAVGGPGVSVGHVDQGQRIDIVRPVESATGMEFLGEWNPYLSAGEDDIIVRGSKNPALLTYTDLNTKVTITIKTADVVAAGKTGCWICVKSCGPIQDPDTGSWTTTPEPKVDGTVDEYWEPLLATDAERVEKRTWLLSINGQRYTIQVASSNIAPATG
jgi:hypothetical protein